MKLGRTRIAAGRSLPIRLLLFVWSCINSSSAWISPSRNLQHRVAAVVAGGASSSTRLQKVPLDFLSPYESKIPDDLKDEIYKAEANTPAAKDRGQRVALYAVIAFVLIFCAFFNGFLTELRADVDANGTTVDLVEAGFGWVQANFLFSFLFLNKIGGGICKEPIVAEPEEPVAEIEEEKEVAATDDKKEGGLFGGRKDFYDQADSMAASQALLLNKKLEEVGVVEKITDETGLKVIGKEAAKLKEKQEAGESNSEKKG
jgi:hypothetical protein